MYGLLVVLIIKLAIAFYKEMMYCEKPGMRRLIYEINGRQSNISMQHYYLELLGLSNCKEIDQQVVSKAFYDKLRKVADSRLSGEKIFFELEDLRAAKAYLYDACNYMCPQN